jgi:spermidine synthase
MNSFLGRFAAGVIGFLALFYVLRSLREPISALVGADSVVEKIDSEYNSIIVEKRGSVVSLNFGYRNLKYTESAIDLDKPTELIVRYTRYMSVALAYVQNNIATIGMVGLGGGRTISYLSHSLPDATADVAELDPAVIDAAKRYFGTMASPRLRIHAQDGRVYFSSARQKYDLILLDAYRGPFVPFHLTTKEFYQLIKSRLSEGGVVAQNVEPNTLYFDSAFVTMKSVFDQVDSFDAGGNIVLVGYSGKKLSDDELAAGARRTQDRFKLRYALSDLIKARKMVNVDQSAKILTDDFAPVENLKIIKRHNEKRE